MITLLEVKIEKSEMMESVVSMQSQIQQELRQAIPDRSFIKRTKSVLKRLGKKIEYASMIENILNSGIPHEAMRKSRNELLIKMRAVQDREPRNTETETFYTTEEQKNPEIKKKIKQHYKQYDYEKMQKQYRTLQYILKP